MAIVRPDQNSGGGGGGSGTVTNVSSANTSIAVATPTTTPVLTVATLDVLAANGPPAAAVAMNSQKITGLANGASAQDALAFGQVFASGAIPIADIANPGAGKVIGSSGGVAAAVNPPGFEIGYDQITAGVTVSSTTEATGTTVISAAAHTFDGGAVLAHFFTPTLVPPTTLGNQIWICLFEGATEIGRLCSAITPNSSTQGCAANGFLRFTPTAASHTYTVTGFISGGTGAAVVAGASGTGANVPAFIRFTKV